MNVKYQEGTKVKASFMTYRKNTSKQSIPELIIDDGIVVFDEEKQGFYVESLKELPCVYFEDNGKSYNNFKSWLVQDYKKLKTAIKNIVEVVC
jgi:hypothetical protein